jgi:hypothetical protein
MSEQAPEPIFPDDAVAGAETIPAPRRWIVLQNVQEVETWIDTYNRELQAVVFRHKMNTVNAGQGMTATVTFNKENFSNEVQYTEVTVSTGVAKLGKRKSK